jgi:hypothetical protein
VSGSEPGEVRPPEGGDDVVVLGAEMARANAAQKHHQALHGLEVSPLGGVSYAREAVDLWRWTPAGQDDLVLAALADFQRLDVASRDRFRASLSQNDFYTLITFARRCALAAIRTGESAKVRSALAALSAVDLVRVDWRDVVVAAALVCYVGQRLEMDPAEGVGNAVMMAQTPVGEVLTRASSHRVDLAKACGLREVETSTGRVFIDQEGAPFTAGPDLVRRGLSVAAMLEADRYRVTRLASSSGNQMHRVWLRPAANSTTEQAVGALAGCLTVRAEPRVERVSAISVQFLLVLLAEAGTAAEAAVIAEAANAQVRTATVELGVAVRRRCAVLIARSAMPGVACPEDAVSLARFHDRIAALLT